MAILCRHLVQSVGEGRIGMENETDSALQLSFEKFMVSSGCAWKPAFLFLSKPSDRFSVMNRW